MAARSTPAADGPGAGSGAWLPGNRWTYVTVVFGLLFAGVQVVHTDSMRTFGTTGIVLEGILPLVFALGVAVSGPWLHYRGYTRAEQRRVVGWMAVLGVAAALLFLWALSHQILVAENAGGGSDTGGLYGSTDSGVAAATDGTGYVSTALEVFPHAHFVTMTNLTAGALLGLVLGLYDVSSRRYYRTARRERERVAQQRSRLSVLNRVLRHNLRNNAAAILGSMKLVQAQVDGDPAAHAETAATKTSELVEIAEKVRDVDQTLGDELTYTDEVDIGTVIEDALDTLDERVECTVDAAQIRVRTNRALLARLLEELVENAVEHPETDPVRLRITATTDADGWVDIVVADNGSGIPEHERVSFDADEETALEHGSGLGLWLVRWGVTSLGGDISYRTSEWGGAAVHLRLPDAPDSAALTDTDPAVTPSSQPRR